MRAVCPTTGVSAASASRPSVLVNADPRQRLSAANACYGAERTTPSNPSEHDAPATLRIERTPQQRSGREFAADDILQPSRPAATSTFRPPERCSTPQIHDDGSDTAGAARLQPPIRQRFGSTRADQPVRARRRRSARPTGARGLEHPTATEKIHRSFAGSTTRAPQPHSHPSYRSRRGILFFTAAATRASSSEWDALIGTALPTSKLIPNAAASTTADHNPPSNFTRHHDRWRPGVPASTTPHPTVSAIAGRFGASDPPEPFSSLRAPATATQPERLDCPGRGRIRSRLKATGSTTLHQQRRRICCKSLPVFGPHNDQGLTRAAPSASEGHVGVQTSVRPPRSCAAGLR